MLKCIKTHDSRTVQSITKIFSWLFNFKSTSINHFGGVTRKTEKHLMTEKCRKTLKIIAEI